MSDANDNDLDPDFDTAALKKSSESDDIFSESEEKRCSEGQEKKPFFRKLKNR